jgi:hypothetical protein
LLELRQRYVKGSNYIRSASLSPSGQRAVFDFRGEIVTVPAEKGDPEILHKLQACMKNFLPGRQMAPLLPTSAMHRANMN